MLEAIHRNTRVVVDLSIVKQNIKKADGKIESFSRTLCSGES